MPSIKNTQGESGERLASALLLREGYRILERNYRCRQGEIDIIAEEGEVLVFVEVRSRRSDAYGDPLETVDFVKQSRITHAARHYLAAQRKMDRQVRFDVVGIVYSPQTRTTLVRGAFEPESAW